MYNALVDVLTLRLPPARIGVKLRNCTLVEK